MLMMHVAGRHWPWENTDTPRLDFFAPTVPWRSIKTFINAPKIIKYINQHLSILFIYLRNPGKVKFITQYFNARGTTKKK